ncbi:MAG TPA: hypothetical protein VJP87_03635 [Candidatus Acidoferrales bacterium]|nr:hypothetical protein [Candidatus Acidoferrales bacterium]
MRMNPGEHWHCSNIACRAELVVYRSSTDGSNPRCACGSVMKREYTPPVFRYLEFLHLEPVRGAVPHKD